jgi:hypothetical protein
MDNRQGNVRGFISGAEGACAVASGLLLIVVLAAAFAMGEWNMAGQMLPEGEYATIWQRLDAEAGSLSGGTQLARPR